MNGINDPIDRPPNRLVAILVAAGVALQWLCQPPLGWWPIAFVAIIPWLMIVRYDDHFEGRDQLIIWLAGLVYWLLTLQGLRHAHPAIYVGWFALAAYLSVYGVLFVALSRRMVRLGAPLWVTAPVVWVGLECVRNYFATGISAAMLGHTLADVPELVQIADLFGSYGVSFVVVAVNVAVYELIASRLPFLSTPNAAVSRPTRSRIVAVAAAIIWVACTIGYGRFRLKQTVGEKDLATFALIQRSEVVEFPQGQKRDVDIFYNYARQTVTTLESTSEKIDAVVWPESMFSGGKFWVADPAVAVVPAEFTGNDDEFREWMDYDRQEFLVRAADLQNAFATSNTNNHRPQIIGGCGVIRYAADPQMFSGIVQVDSDGQVTNWYGKTHRVMLGEHIPILSSITVLRPYIPLGLRLSKGPGPTNFQVGQTNVSPNICIETAVERVPVDHLSQLRQKNALPDVILTVSNDGWFDNSSVIDHHLRCAQMVAVGCRRPILSSSNNGPTAWIDSRGQIVQRLATGTEGAIIAKPEHDSRVSVYVTIGDWPARVLAIVCLGLIAVIVKERYLAKRQSKN
ncbi:apolipoprotein N-acyltransferase [Planctomycetes bacterium K23_9]